MDSINSDSLTFSIKDVLLRINLALSNCRGQCYDGASNIIGAENGVAKQLAGIEPRVLYAMPSIW